MTAETRGQPSAVGNRFDALRLTFASFVFIYHIYALAEIDPGSAVEKFASQFADIGVKGFFVISGALVFGSLQRSETIQIYFSKRARRLFPAYAVIIALPTIAATFYALFSGGLADGLSSIAAYFGANILFLNFLHPELPGFFENNRFTAVNGALWTIKIEVMFYIALPILGLIIARLKTIHALALLLAVYIAGDLWRMTFEALAQSENSPLLLQLARQLPGQMPYFASGIALWMMRYELKGQIFRIGLIGAALVAFSLAPPLEILRPAGIATLIAFAAWAPGPILKATRWGDLSYGVYITHFPIIQSLAAFGVFAQSPALGVLLSLALVFVSSLAMWRWVERPWLRKDSHYRQKRSAQN